MSLRSQIVEAQKDAMKSKESEKLSVLRLLFSSIKNAEIDKGHELSDEEIVAIVRSEVKQLSQASKEFALGGRTDLVEKNQQEADILKQFLPAEISDEEIEAAVQKIISETDPSMLNVGAVMGSAMKELKGRADGNRVRACVEKILTD